MTRQKKKGTGKGRTTSIYIPVEYEPLVADALKASGQDKLGEMTYMAWREFVERRHGLPAGFERISVLTNEDRMPVKKTFVGRWVIAPGEAFRPEYRGEDGTPELGRCYAAALTSKGNWMVQVWDAEDTTAEVTYNVYPSLEAIRDANASQQLLEELAMRSGAAIEKEWEI